ncbi:tRNA pseudouridine(55) synthase TruB [Desulfohalobiaceae bacterium Ax17]|uniref:tRNA pseudouridine(55) synthase TruB n=1 Tax=Desulfovulcanus ferrireducens TaxID=2831190 RepID=UPI00207BCBBC|nr:tRNA pseudouridine(55) synthase TruB [Desulfovulcanus ferrireducens]MBT8763775.1 tRNA pseudouridine(55) synthase TruB [Desulfovulcanus ferrireducens]
MNNITSSLTLDSRTSTFPSGVLVLNKPKGPTSTACLNRIKKRFKPKKIGHAGTLDPLAQGVLLVLFGQATKLANYLGQGKKTYAGTLRLGLVTDTYDIEGKIEAELPWDNIREEDVVQEILNWKNLQEQEVPPVSAAKYKGKPLYVLKRTGQKVPLKTKAIKIFEAQVIHIDLPEINFRVTCSQGTYIRSLAHSLGKRLGCGAVLTELIREKCHPFGLEQAFDLEEVLKAEQLEPFILSIPKALSHWPQATVSTEAEKLIRHGHALDPELVPELPQKKDARALLVNEKGQELALVQAKVKDGRLRWTILRGLWTQN